MHNSAVRLENSEEQPSLPVVLLKKITPGTKQ
jgi:hypothetical protein